MKTYRVPRLSLLALWLAVHVVPNRVFAAIVIMTLDGLAEHYRPVNHHNEDGSRELFDAVSAIRIEKLRRNVWRYQLNATVEEK